ncbi:hypothetical protein Hanom_Chr06g00554201 [Helianthus anomalus]
MMSISHLIKPQNHKSACWNLSEFVNRMLKVSEFVKPHVRSFKFVNRMLESSEIVKSAYRLVFVKSAW